MYSAEQSGWGHSPTHGPGEASQWVNASNWCGPQRAFARGHGLQALTARPRGACPLTGRDRDVGRTNQIERSLKEVSGLKASRSSAQSVSQVGPCAAARATILHLVESACAPPHEAGRRCSKLNTRLQVAVRIEPRTGLGAIQANTGATAFHDDRRKKDHRI